MMEGTIEHAKFRALAQLQVDPKEGVTAFEEYMKVAFPYLETQKRRDRQQYIDILNREISKGLIAVSPVAQPRIRSRMRARQNITRTAAEELSLYNKLGRFTP
jgi:hypothetical protein